MSSTNIKAQQEGTCFCMWPTSRPPRSSTIGKFTSLQGPHGSGQQRPHWQQSPAAFSTVLSRASRMVKVKSKHAHGSVIEPIRRPVEESLTSTLGRLKQQHVQVQSRSRSKAFSILPSFAYTMLKCQGAQSGKQDFSCLVHRSVSSAATKTFTLPGAYTVYLFPTTSNPKAADTSPTRLACSSTSSERSWCMQAMDACRGACCVVEP
mmetsp:Transcript_3098/g.8351  ORF Transcript_3098/g.8351 Transcript_3098/m.8351 type:complete len:207 (+) Transcript_3098:321-941(+)